MQGELLVLRLVHVLGGMIWVGGSAIMAFFVAPAIGAAGPAGGQVMAAIVKRRYMVVMPVIAVLTILSGIRLMQRTSMGFSPEWFATVSGKVYAATGLLAILTFLYGVLVARPAAMRLGALGQQVAAAQGAEKEQLAAQLQAQQAKSRFALQAVTWLLLVAAAGMGVARYL